MPLLRDADPRFKWLSAKVGFFALLALVGAVLLLLGLAIKQGYFANKVPLRIVAESGLDLKEGMAVKLSGFKVGRVASVRLNEQAKVDVEMMIEQQYMHWLRADSRVYLTKEGVIGDSVLQISTGSPGQPQVAAGAVLPYLEGKGVSEIAEDLHRRVIPLIEDVSELLKYLNSPKGDVKMTLGNFNRFSKDMNGALHKLDATLANLERTSGQDLPARLEQVRESLARVDQSLSQVQERLPGWLDRTDRSLGEVEGGIKEVRDGIGNVRRTVDESLPEIPKALRQGNVLLKQGEGLLQQGSGLLQQSRGTLQKGDQLLTEGNRFVDTSQDALDALSRSWPLNRLLNDERPLNPQLNSAE